MRDLAINDIVIVEDDNLPRNCWQLARVSRTDVAKDGHVRTVQVVLVDPALTADGRRTRPLRYLERPVQKLILLLPSSTVPE